ncbi:HET domain-containing protein [Apiospora phragmitis]|uniref:HET domain-containing protein n=1 Tax=Apiospora phragmitis TaxID=2905665 RepID=A0ABR1W3P4_9PEZI
MSNDHTIFCWKWIQGIVPQEWTSLLAPSQDAFRKSGNISQTEPQLQPGLLPDLFDDSTESTYSMTNGGLSIELPSVFTSSYQLCCLEGKEP